jgi:transketolase
MSVNYPNRQVFTKTLLSLAKKDSRIIALASDSRGSASLDQFATELPAQFVEVGIAEQNLVSIAAGLAKCGKIPFACSPACFLSMRSIEQIKVDGAYSHTNIRLIGISGGVSYGALGSTHHSLQDLAAIRAIPDITVIVPSDNIEMEGVTRLLIEYDGPVYLRTGRGPVADVHGSNFIPEIGKGCLLLPGNDLTIVATGEVVRVALDAGYLLHKQGIGARVVEIHTVKPLDQQIILAAAEETKAILTVEEHSVYGGLGGSIAELVSQSRPVPLRILGIPDELVVTGTQAEIFQHYGLTVEGIAKEAAELMKKK